MNDGLQPVPLTRAYRLLNHGPVTLVSTAHGGQRNLMAASWAMPLDFDPPKLAVVIDRNTHSRALLEASGAFVLNIPAVEQAELVLGAGTLSGRDGDKFARLGARALELPGTPVPGVAGCLGWLACQVLAEPENAQRHDLFVAMVTGAWADPAAFSDGRWHFPDAARRTLHYQAGGVFLPSGEPFKVQAAAS